VRVLCANLASRHNAAMDTDLRAVAASLAAITDTELHALIDATHDVPQTAPGFFGVA
jgi:hypothetical protein